MSATLTSASPTSRKLDQQIEMALQDGETVRARIDGCGRFAGWLESLPFVRHGLEFSRGRYELVLTTQRLFVIRVGRVTRRVKSFRACRLSRVIDLQVLKGFLQSDLRLKFADGRELRIGRIATSAAQEFVERFPTGGFANALAATVRETLERTMKDDGAPRPEYRTPAA